MGYQFKRNESIEDGLRRIATSQLDAALKAAGTGGPGAPHEVRKRCKKLRGLLRLVGDALPDGDAEQRVARDVGRVLAAVRESAAQLEALTRLERAVPARLDDPDFIAVRGFLEAACDAHQSDGSAARAMADATAMLRAQRERAAHWRLEQKGFAAFASGLVDTYRQARRRYRAALQRPASKRLHALRKWAKYHRHHLGLLHAMWPDAFKAWGEAAEEVGELLGQNHDIAVLLDVVRNGHREALAAGVHGRLAAQVAVDADGLRDRALALSARLLAEKPRCFEARMASYWQAWHERSV
jgi:hypothetical protein